MPAAPPLPPEVATPPAPLVSPRTPLIERPLPPEVRATLSPLERVHVELALRMNREPFKGVWTTVQRLVGASVVRLLTGNLLQVHGFEHVEEGYKRGALLFVANHRTYFDMFIVSTLVHRHIPGRKRLFFPVVGQYYYQSWVGLALNQVAASWSMFPPLFALPTHAASDRYAMEILIDLCAQGTGHVLGIHPEGGRNLDPDPWSFMRFQPGTGKIIHAARPIVVPTFITGMTNDIAEQVRRNFEGGEPIRVWFDAPLDLSRELSLPGKGSTYKLITDTVMSRVQALADADRARYGSASR